MYLLDSNLFLELLLDQRKADEVEQLLRRTPREKLHVSEFSLYSVGIVLFRRKLFEVFAQFLDELVLIRWGSCAQALASGHRGVARSSTAI